MPSKLNRFKARKFNPRKHKTPRFATRKYDGHRHYMDDDGVYTSNETDVTSKVHKYPWYSLMRDFLEPGHEIDFELISPGHPAEHVKTALKHHQCLNAIVFAATQFDDDESIVVVHSQIMKAGLSVPSLQQQYTIDGLLAYSRKYKMEGWVLKDGNYNNWLKLKPNSTIDLVVVGIRPGRRKYDGQVGALVCATTEGHIVAACSGMTDEQRILMGSRDIGRVVEVQYERVGSRGRLRFPQFVRWRDDKTADECGLDQEPDLEDFWS